MEDSWRLVARLKLDHVDGKLDIRWDLKAKITKIKEA